MCGRFTLARRPAAIAAEFDIQLSLPFEPRYNIAPSQNVTAIRATADGHEYVPLRWGLVPAWADDVKIGYRLINARAETVATKPAFRAAYRRRRCLIAADGYFEWQSIGKKKQPHYFRLADD